MTFSDWQEQMDGWVSQSEINAERFAGEAIGYDPDLGICELCGCMTEDGICNNENCINHFAENIDWSPSPDLPIDTDVDDCPF